MPQKIERQIHQVDDLSSSRKHHLLNLLQQLVESSTSQSLCHGDFHFFNLIKTKKRNKYDRLGRCEYWLSLR